MPRLTHLLTTKPARTRALYTRWRAAPMPSCCCVARAGCVCAEASKSAAWGANQRAGRCADSPRWGAAGPTHQRVHALLERDRPRPPARAGRKQQQAAAACQVKGLLRVQVQDAVDGETCSCRWGRFCGGLQPAASRGRAPCHSRCSDSSPASRPEARCLRGPCRRAHPSRRAAPPRCS